MNKKIYEWIKSEKKFVSKREYWKPVKDKALLFLTGISDNFLLITMICKKKIITGRLESDIE